MDVKSRAHKDGEYSLEDVQRCGKDEDTILVSILGVCYDVSSGKEFFGPSGPYRVYAGHDISYALAMMSLKASDVDKFDYKLDEDEDKQTLADWIAYFDVKYTRAGTVVDVHHPYSLADLPQGKDPHNFINAAHPSTSGTASNAERAAFDAALAAASSEGNEPTKLSSWLIAETNDLHEKALYGNFMQALMARNVPMDIYAKWLGCLYHVYTELEYQLDIHQNEALIKAVDDPSVLRRLPNIKVDLEHFFGADVARAVRLAPSLHTIRYVSRISDIAAKPHLLLVHHWMRYGGGLAGGQFLKSALRATFKLQPSSEGKTLGVRYHEFDAIGDVQQYYISYLAKLDALSLTEAERVEMRDEARTAFQLNLNLNHEFDNLPGIVALNDATSKL